LFSKISFKIETFGFVFILLPKTNKESIVKATRYFGKFSSKNCWNEFEVYYLTPGVRLFQINYCLHCKI